MEALSFKTEQFEGPLDLLLSLISKNKVDIKDIIISELLEQYLEYLDTLRGYDLDIASEFLEMAARLVYIKTVSLLPRHDESESLRQELVGELLEYELCRKMAVKLSEMTEGFGRFVRAPAEIIPDKTYTLLHEPSELVEAFSTATGRGQRRLPPPMTNFSGIVARRIVSVSSKIVFVLRSIWTKKKIPFVNLFLRAESRSDVIATFLAILELVKARRIVVTEGNEAQVVLLDSAADETPENFK